MTKQEQIEQEVERISSAFEPIDLMSIGLLLLQKVVQEEGVALSALLAATAPHVAQQEDLKRWMFAQGGKV